MYVFNEESAIRDQIVRDFSPLVPIGNDSDSLSLTAITRTNRLSAGYEMA